MTTRNRRQAYRPILRIWAMQDVMYAKMENGKRKPTAPNELVVAADQKKKKQKKQQHNGRRELCRLPFRRGSVVVVD
jgi:hypothetical protein